MQVRLGEPVEVMLNQATRSCHIYSLWSAEGVCLYVGQTTQEHPITRIMQHRTKLWWPEVRHAIIRKLESGSLDEAEQQQIDELHPKYNQAPAWLKPDF